MKDPMIAGRIAHVRDICVKAIEHDGVQPDNPLALTNRQWLAQSVINILDGLIDAQIAREINEREQA